MCDKKKRSVLNKTQGRQKPKKIKQATPDVLVNHALSAYLKQFQAWAEMKGLTEQTLKTRAGHLKRFIIWCDERSINHPKEVTKPILERYQRYLFEIRQKNGEPLSFRTQAGQLASLKAFFKWLARENHILSNPASELEAPRYRKRLPKQILSVEEVNRVLDLPDVHSPYGLRDKAILELLYSCGIRRMELSNLEVQDIDRGRETILIQEGKGRKDRMLPLGKRALYWVEKYRLESRPLMLNDAYEQHLFLTDYGEPFANNYNRLSNLVKLYLNHARIDKKGSCHLFRHAMATHMLDNGADIRFIQAMLGHSNLSTTEIYTQVSVEKLREIHAATHPAKLEIEEATEESKD